MGPASAAPPSTRRCLPRPGGGGKPWWKLRKRRPRPIRLLVADDIPKTANCSKRPAAASASDIITAFATAPRPWPRARRSSASSCGAGGFSSCPARTGGISCGPSASHPGPPAGHSDFGCRRRRRKGFPKGSTSRPRPSQTPAPRPPACRPARDLGFDQVPSGAAAARRRYPRSGPPTPWPPPAILDELRSMHAQGQILAMRWADRLAAAQPDYAPSAGGWSKLSCQAVDLPDSNAFSTKPPEIGALRPRRFRPVGPWQNCPMRRLPCPSARPRGTSSPGRPADDYRRRPHRRRQGPLTRNLAARQSRQPGILGAARLQLQRQPGTHRRRRGRVGDGNPHHRRRSPGQDPVQTPRHQRLRHRAGGRHGAPPAINTGSNSWDAYAYAPTSFPSPTTGSWSTPTWGAVRGGGGHLHATWGSVSEIQVSNRAWVIGETFGRSQERSWFQVGLRYWIVPERVQIDTTYGNGYNLRAAAAGFPSVCACDPGLPTLVRNSCARLETLGVVAVGEAVDTDPPLVDGAWTSVRRRCRCRRDQDWLRVLKRPGRRV